MMQPSLQPQPVHQKRWFPVLATIILIYGGLVTFWPAPKATGVASNIAAPAETVELPWPASGQAAIGALDYGLLESGGDQILRLHQFFSL